MVLYGTGVTHQDTIYRINLANKALFAGLIRQITFSYKEYSKEPLNFLLLFGGLMVCNGFVDGGYTVSLVFCFSSKLRGLTWARIKLNNNLVSGECLSR